MKVLSLVAIGSLMSVMIGMADTQAATPQNWPGRPIKLIVPFPAGGGPERTIRTISQGLQERLGQPVIIDYRPGASGNIGAADLAKANPDGYTWMLAQDSLFTINPLIFESLGFDINAIQPVSMYGNFVNVLVCNPSLNVTSLEGLIEKAKAGPGEIYYASSGAGSPGHLVTEMLSSRAGIKMSHVPYRGPMPAVQDLLGGHVDCGFLASPSVVEHVKAGRMVALGSSGAEPLESLEGLPTIDSQGFPGFDATFWTGFYTSTGVDKEITDRFGAALYEVLKEEAVLDAMEFSDMKPRWTTQEETQEIIENLLNQWSVVVQQVGLKVE
ncbi:MAG: tripartite tricarboxylate transporter substrate binding protein [Pigmentiphaga sp.]|nr:tripartite tricarboxylate transporter substrate binding protein [Pigmentiphaga sp.]